jgi:beta-lactam-binding protein with PASTA domain
MRVAEALGALRQVKLKFKIAWGPTDKDFLLVIAQDPAAGKEVDPGTAVTITIGLPSFSFEKPTTLPAPQPAPQPVPQPAPEPAPQPAPTPPDGGAPTTSAP